MEKCKFCGGEGKYKFKNGFFCCMEFTSQCPEIIRKISEKNKGRKVSLETRNKIKNKITGLKRDKKTRNKLSKLLTGRKISEEHRKNISSGMKNYFNTLKNNYYKKLTEEKIRQKYKFFSMVEKIRTKNGEIQVKCKLNTCRKWFTPTYIQLYERIRQLEKDYGNDGSYFYCSDECKNICPLYRLQSDPYKNNELPYTQQEYQTFRLHVLERDNYECQFCGKEASDVHHERPQKIEPFFALDPDFAWASCEKCHYEKGHSGECSTARLAKTICN